MIAVQFVPLDTWFFRDGTPFTAQSAPQEDVGSLFPPYPPTLVGALRAALARANGWDEAGRWPPELCEVLGDGPEDLGVLSFAGPFLLRDGQPLFQAPRHLLGASRECGWRPAGFLRPGSPVACDLGHVPLPEFPDAVGDAGTLKTADDVWLTALGMNAVLRGQLPGTDDVVSSRSLWTPEHRIGLKRDKAVRAAKEGMLYSSRHVRPGRAISLGVRVSGLPEEWTPRALSELAPLGGESRVAELTPWSGDLHLAPPLDLITRTRRVSLIAVSPLDLETETCRGQQSVPGLGEVRVVSACLARPQRVGGWDSLGRRPLAVRSVLPPGSVLYCEIVDLEGFESAVAFGNGTAQVGSRQEWGFGLAALGVWPDEDQSVAERAP